VKETRECEEFTLKKSNLTLYFPATSWKMTLLRDFMILTDILVTVAVGRMNDAIGLAEV
jgi:hypothetical protein